jgi:hypothetical protein
VCSSRAGESASIVTACSISGIGSVVVRETRHRAAPRAPGVPELLTELELFQRQPPGLGVRAQDEERFGGLCAPAGEHRVPDADFPGGQSGLLARCGQRRIGPGQVVGLDQRVQQERQAPQRGRRRRHRQLVLEEDYDIRSAGVLPALDSVDELLRVINGAFDAAGCDVSAGARLAALAAIDRDAGLFPDRPMLWPLLIGAWKRKELA